MIDEIALEELALEIMSQGVEEETAYNYAALIGDTPLMEGDHIIVRDGTKEVARLKPLKFFGMN